MSMHKPTRHATARTLGVSDCGMRVACFVLSVLQAVLPASVGSVELGGSIVHLFEWSWQDVAIECEDWLGPAGFEAVQISPPSEHIQGEHLSSSLLSLLLVLTGTLN